MNRNPRSGGNVRSGLRILLSGDAAANGIDIETGILRGFDGNPQILAEKGWNLNTTFFYIENYGSPGRQSLRR
jgi:hypothetical protein